MNVIAARVKSAKELLSSLTCYAQVADEAKKTYPTL